MEMKLRKLWPLLGVVGVGLFAPVLADQCQLSCGSQSAADTQQADQRAYWRGAHREMSASGSTVADGVALFFQAEPFYWRAVEDRNSFAAHGFKDDDTTTKTYQPAPLGREEFAKSKWTPGIAVGVGTRPRNDSWDASFRYTYFRPRRETQMVFSPSIYVPPITNFRGDLTFKERLTTGAEASWKFEFNVLDLEFGWNGCMGACLTTRPYVGMKATWQKESYDFVFFSDSEFRLAYGPEQYAHKVGGPYFLDCRYSVFGVGPRVGCSFSWLLCNCLNIYGDFSWSVLWADYYDQRRVDTLRDGKATPAVEAVVSDLSNKHNHCAKSLCEFECGLSWDQWFCCDSYHFEVRLGWKEQVWVNWVKDFNLQNGAYSNLSLYGPKLTVQFGF